MMRSAGGFLGVMLLWALAAPSEGAVLRGRVMALDGHPVVDVRLQIVGHAPTLPIRSPSGTFEVPLAGDPSEVEASVVEGPLRIVFPLNGRIAVPKNDSIYVAIVVDKTEESYISELLAGRLVQLESTLHANGVHYDAAMDSVGETLRRILSQLEIRESDLRREVVFQREQAAFKPEVLSVIADYMLELKDLRDAFHDFAPLAAKERGAMEALQQAVLAYNARFELLSRNREAYQSRVLSYWEGDRAEILNKYLLDFYREAIDETNAALILPVNQSLIQLHLAHGKDRPSDRALAAAADTLQITADRLGERIRSLEQRVQELQGALQRN